MPGNPRRIAPRARPVSFRRQIQIACRAILTNLSIDVYASSGSLQRFALGSRTVALKRCRSASGERGEQYRYQQAVTRGNSKVYVNRSTNSIDTKGHRSLIGQNERLATEGSRNETHKLIPGNGCAICGAPRSGQTSPEVSPGGGGIVAVGLAIRALSRVVLSSGFGRSELATTSGRSELHGARRLLRHSKRPTTDRADLRWADVGAPSRTSGASSNVPRQGGSEQGSGMAAIADGQISDTGGHSPARGHWSAGRFATTTEAVRRRLPNSSRSSVAIACAPPKRDDNVREVFPTSGSRPPMTAGTF